LQTTLSRLSAKTTLPFKVRRPLLPLAGLSAVPRKILDLSESGTHGAGGGDFRDRFKIDDDFTLPFFLQMRLQPANPNSYEISVGDVKTGIKPDNFRGLDAFPFANSNLFST
jgi:hypothetical protein